MGRIHLQGIGKVEAIPAEEVKAGMLVSWNYSPNGYEVVSIERATTCFLNMTERDVKTGETYLRRVRIGRLVAAEFPKGRLATVGVAEEGKLF